MRKVEWTAAFAIVGGIGLAACAPADEEAPREQPAAEAPAAQPPAAQPPAPTGPLPEGVTPEMVAQGKQIFEGPGNCYTCHGMDGSGGPLAPNLRDDQWLWLDPAKGDLLAQAETLIRNGVPQPKEFPAPMPPMGGAQLTDQQIRDVAAYVVALSSGSGS